uniref:Cyclic nucleotide-binding domain-containing protein n=1 Tax=Spongospora subterranea TaxID=70186 RepID=A0A0H5RQ29_9EUKA|eukprot:CRZ10804.1 hypothetical protein [Spongospora subterranea]
MFGDEVLRSQAVVSNSYVARTFCQLFVLETNDVKAVLAAFPIEAAFMAKMAKGKGGRQKGKGNDNLFEDKDRGKRCRLPLFSPRSFAGSLLASAQKSIALYNAFIILLRIGFEVEGPLLLSALIIDAFVDIISLICIIAHFHQQYSLNGELVYSRNAIAKDYFTGTFAVDLIALLPIHVVSITDPLLRVPRLVGLFRYFVAKENVRSNTTLTKLMMSVTSFCLITHLVSCCYFGMAKIQGFARDDEAFLPSLDVQHQSLFQQYSIATLLTLKILTGRGNKPQAFPESELELVFLILSSMLGLFGVAYLIGEISVLVAHFNPLHFIHQLDVDNINNFMNYKKVPLSLQRRVRSYLDYRWECTQGIGLKGAISDLPRALRLRVLEHVTLQYVRQVPMFSELSENLIQSILECFDYMCIPAQEYVYRKSEMGSNMYIILDGIVALSHSGNDSFYMGPGSFFGEEAILNKIGLRDTSVRTNTGCTLATLTADALEQALESFSEEDQMKIVNELIDPPHDKDSAHEAILNMMDMMVADNFYILNVDSPVSVNLHTGKELFTFIARRLNCTEKNAILFADSLLAKGNLRALGILSPNNHNSEKVALNNPRSETADERPKVAPNTLYRLINFNIAATLDSAGGQDIRAPTEDTSSTSDSATSHRKKTSRTSLSKSQTLLLKASVSYKNLFSKKAGLESPQDTDFSD